MSALEQAARLKDEFPGVNIGNYNDDDVARLNAWGCEVYDLLAALAQPEAREPRGYIDVVFDGPPGPESGRFVEVEDATGKSIRFGEWVERADGYWVLRFTPSALAQPPDGGEVVEVVTSGDALSDAAQMLRQAHAWAFYRLKCPVEDLPKVTRRVQLAWLEVADQLHAAGLLAGEVDRERLARVLHWHFQDVPRSVPWEVSLETSKETWRAKADVILREMGR